MTDHRVARPPRAPDPATGWDVLDRWESVSFDELTRAVLARRLAPPPPRRFLDEAAYATLVHACARLLATPPDDPPLASRIDEDLAEGRGEGFRSPGDPPLQAAWRQGLAGLDATARRRHGAPFAALPPAAQDDTLRALQRGEADREAFGGQDPARFFTHVLLKAAAAHFYARPQAWSEIGFGGPASPRGYLRLPLDRRDPWEGPLPPPTPRADAGDDPAEPAP